MIIGLILGSCIPGQPGGKPAAGTGEPAAGVTPTQPPSNGETLPPEPTPTSRVIFPDLALQPLGPDNSASISQVKMLGDGRLQAAVFSPDGKWIAAGSTIGLRLHEGSSLVETLFLATPKPVTGIAFSADGSLLAFAMDGGKVRVYDLAQLTLPGGTGNPPMHEFQSGYYANNALAFSPDGASIACGSMDRTVNIWDLASGKKVRSMSGFTLGVTTLVYSPDGELIAAGSLDGILRVWRARSSEPLATTGTADKKRVYADHYPVRMHFIGDNLLLAVYADGGISSWDTSRPSAEPQVLKKPGQDIIAAAMETNGKRLVIATGESIQVYSITAASGQVTLQLSQTFPLDADILALDTFASGGSLLVGSYPARLSLISDEDGLLQVSYSRQAQGGQVIALSFSPDGSLLASAHGDSLVRIWEAANMGNFFEITPDSNEAAHILKFTPDGSRLVAGSDNIYIYFTSGFKSTLSEKPAFPDGPAVIQLVPEKTIQTGGSVRALDVSNDSRNLAASIIMQNIVNVWDLESGERSAHFLSQLEPVESLAFSPDGTTLAVGSADHKIYLWRTERFGHSLDKSPLLPGDEDFMIRNEYAVLTLDYSPDGSLLAVSGAYPQGRVIDSGDGGLVFRLKGSKDQLVSLAFSADGDFVATGGADGNIRLYIVGNEEPVATLQGHYGMVNTLAFSPDGRILVSGGDDGTIRVWGVR